MTCYFGVKFRHYTWHGDEDEEDDEDDDDDDDDHRHRGFLWGFHAILGKVCRCLMCWRRFQWVQIIYMMSCIFEQENKIGSSACKVFNFSNYSILDAMKTGASFDWSMFWGLLRSFETQQGSYHQTSSPVRMSEKLLGMLYFQPLGFPKNTNELKKTTRCQLKILNLLLGAAAGPSSRRYLYLIWYDLIAKKLVFTCSMGAI